MNDFLHNLRSGKDKRYDRPRRNYDGSSHYRPGDRHGNLDRKRRGSYQSSGDNAYMTIAKVLPSVRTLLESYAEDRKKLIQLEDRKTAAMESIAFYLKHLVSKDLDLPEDVKVEETKVDKEDPSELSKQVKVDEEDLEALSGKENQSVSREELIEMINNMRDQKYSYEKVAQELETRSIPTPSGRGKWRGQTVSKLLNTQPG
jgi:hypothetical protein